MSTKEALHRLIDELPETELVVLERFAEFLQSRHLSQAALSSLLAEAPTDNEPLTEEDVEALAAAERSSPSERISQDDLRRKLGL